jgi:hypothetical protein
MSIKPCIVVLLVLLSCLNSFAAPVSNDSSSGQSQDADRQWMQLENTPPGVELMVESTGRSSLTGRFVSASDTKLTMNVQQRDVEIDRSAIRRVYAVKERSRSKWTRNGAVLGLAAGFGIGLLVTAGHSGDSNIAPVGMGAIGTLAGAAVGALSGGKHRGKLLYSSK